MKAVQVNLVRDDSYALAAGIATGDIILRINDKPISSPAQVSDEVAKGPCSFTIIRGASQITRPIDSPTLGVVLGEIDFDEHAFAEVRAIADVVLSTAPTIPGRTIVKPIDVVGAQCVYGVNALADLAAGFREFVGGRSVGLQKRISEARSEVCRELKAEAHRVGANGVVAVTFEHAEIGDKGGFMLMVTATGTAVVCD